MIDSCSEDLEGFDGNFRGHGTAAVVLEFRTMGAMITHRAEPSQVREVTKALNRANKLCYFPSSRGESKDTEQCWPRGSRFPALPLFRIHTGRCTPVCPKKLFRMPRYGYQKGRPRSFHSRVRPQEPADVRSLG